MKVLWSDTAISHLLGIFEYTSQSSQVYAERIIDNLTRRSEQITNFPGSGRKVPEYDDDRIREVIEAPYRIIYRVGGERVDVLAVVHSRQPLPPEKPE